MARLSYVNRQYQEQVYQVAPELVDQTMAQTIETGVNIATKMLYANAEAGMNKSLSEANSRLNDLTQEFRLKNSMNPDPNNRDYLAARKEIFQEVKESVSPLVQRDFMGKWSQLERNLDDDNKQWAFKQTQQNINANLKETVQNDLNNAYFAGERFATGANGDIVSVFNEYTGSYNNLYDFSSKHLGEAQARDILSSFEGDYMKSFLSGVVQQNPMAALDLMDREDVKASIGDPASYQKLKDSAEARLFNINDMKTKTEVIDLMRKENSLFAQSQERNLSLVELETAFSDYDVSPSARSVLLKMNGYKATGGTGATGAKLSESEKLSKGVAFMDNFALFLDDKETKTVEDWQKLQNDLYDAIDKKVIPLKEGRELLAELIEPMTGAIEQDVKSFNQDYLNMKTNLGFKELKDFYSNEIEVARWWRPDSEDVKLADNRNKLRLYNLYYGNLRQIAQQSGMSLGDLAMLPQQQKAQFLANATDKTKLDFASGLGLGRFDDPTKATNAVKNKMFQDQRNKAFEKIDNAYTVKSGSVDAQVNNFLAEFGL